MPTLGELIVRLRAEGATETQQAIREVTDTVRSAATGMQSLGLSFAEGKLTALQFASALGALASTAAMFAGVASSALGVRLAAQVEQLAVGFETLVGNAQDASRLLKEITDIGLKTAFSPEDVAEYAKRLLAVGYTAQEVVPVLRTLLDTTAAVGGTSETLGRIALAISQIRSMPRLGGQEIIQLANAGVNIARLVSAAMGRTYTQQEAREYLQSLSGEEVAEVLLRGMERAFGGASERLATRTFIGTLGQLAETVQRIMLPTGALLTGMLKPVAQGLLAVAEQARLLNEAMGGTLGLAVLLGGLRAGWALVVTTVREVIANVTALTAALQALATQASKAAAASAIGGAAASAGGAAAGAAAVGGAAAGAAAAGGRRWLTRIGQWAAGAARSNWALLLVDLAANLLSNLLPQRIGEFVRTAVGGMVIGALIGSLIPGIGTGVGAVAGTLVGIALGLYKFFSASEAATQTAHNTKEMLKELRDLRGDLIGGGRRARRIVSQIEAEMEFARYMRGII